MGVGVGVGVGGGDEFSGGEVVSMALRSGVDVQTFMVCAFVGTGHMLPFPVRCMSEDTASTCEMREKAPPQQKLSPLFLAPTHTFTKENKKHPPIPPLTHSCHQQRPPHPLHVLPRHLPPPLLLHKPPHVATQGKGNPRFVRFAVQIVILVHISATRACRAGNRPCDVI